MVCKGRYRNQKGQFTSQAMSRCFRKYGLTEKQFRALKRAQENRCAICGARLSGKICVDHDHTTKKVRGLLCHKCNTGLGFFEDDPIRLLRAIWYLHLSEEI